MLHLLVMRAKRKGFTKKQDFKVACGLLKYSYEERKRESLSRRRGDKEGGRSLLL